MIYLDNAATSFPKPATVAEAVADALRGGVGNPGRSGHRLARRSEEILDRCRRLAHRIFGGPSPQNYVLTASGTDSLNIAIHGVLRAGDHVVTGCLEHNSVRRPIQAAAASGVEATVVGCDVSGRYRPDEVREALRPNTRLVALTHASNVFGTVQPVAEVGAVCREAGVHFLVDAAQTAGVLPLDVAVANVDLLAAPGHKALWGPMGVGLLYVGPQVRLRPWRVGGIGGAGSGEQMPTEPPHAFEAGTPNVPGLAGLAAGLAALLEIGPAVQRKERELRTELDSSLSFFSTFRPTPHDAMGERLAIECVRVPGLSAHELAMILDEAFDVAVRPGLHCAPGAHDFLRDSPEGSVRISPGFWNTDDEIRTVAAALFEIAKSTGATAVEKMR